MVTRRPEKSIPPRAKSVSRGSTHPADRGYAVQVMIDEQVLDPALRAANLALSGSRRREAGRFASIELRFTDPRTGPWEAAAMTSVALAALVCVIGLWFM